MSRAADKERCLQCGTDRAGWGVCQDADCLANFDQCSSIDRGLLKNTERFVRGVLEETFKQRTTDFQVRQIALAIIANFPPEVKRQDHRRRA